MNQTLLKLLGHLRAAGLSLDIEGARDALWLALRRAEQETSPGLRLSGEVVLPAVASSEPARELKIEEISESDSGVTSGMNPRDLLPGRRLRLSAPPVVLGTRTLKKALQPLNKKVPSPSKLSLDMRGTILRAAEEDVWFPVLRPLPERWLSLALVAERSLSMTVFYSTVRELYRVLRGSGIFRDISLWWLDTEGSEVKAYTRPDDVGRETAARRLFEVPGLGRHTLVLVLSDCVSDGWYDGRVPSVLALWSRNAPVTLLQTLPERMWPRTALGDQVRVRLRSSAELQVNDRLRWAAELPDPRLSGEEALLLPVASLEPASLHNLTRMIAGDSRRWVPGFLFSLKEDQETVPIPSAFEAVERVRRFIALSSSLAVRLASLLAASPVLSLGILHLLRRDLLPEASPVQEAEVLLGGILRVRIAAGASPLDSEEITIEFLEDVRSLLLDNATAGDVLRVLERTASLVESPGLEAPFFEFLLADPVAAAGTLDPEASPMAREAAAVLRRLGGQYARIVREVPSRKAEDSRQVVEGDNREQGGKRIRVLLADNDPDSLATWGELLQDEGYEAIRASSFWEAKDFLDRGGFDLAILEISLSRSEDESDDSGLRLATAYRSSVPIIILTSHLTVEVAIEVLQRDGRSLPAIAFVRKSDGAEALLKAARSALEPKVFVSHGKDLTATSAVVRFLAHANLHPVDLNEQPLASQTIIEAFEEHTNVQFAIILMTPDDEGRLKGESELKPRARQNVIFEFGFLVAKLGRNRVVVLMKQGETVDLPPKFNFRSVLYREMDPRGEWQDEVIDIMKDAGVTLR